MLRMKGLVKPVSAPLTTGTRKLPAASRFWTSCETKNFRNSTASFGEPLVTSQPVIPPSVSLASPLPPDVREIEPAELVVAETDLVGRQHALELVDVADGERHRRFAVAEITDRLLVLETEKAVLEGLQI